MSKRCASNFARRWCSSSTELILTNDLIRKRLSSYIEQTSYIDRLVKSSPEFQQHRKASILVPLYCNSQTNQVEVLVLKRSEKVRSYTGMIAFAGGMADRTDRNAIHTAKREAEEEIGLKPELYSILGCLPPIADTHSIMITPVIALLHSKFVDYQLLLDEIAEAFYLELKQFLFQSNNYRRSKIADHFVSHHFNMKNNDIWGVTAYQLITVAALLYQQVPEFPFFRHNKQLDLENFTQQLRQHFHHAMIYGKEHQVKY